MASANFYAREVGEDTNVCIESDGSVRVRKTLGLMRLVGDAKEEGADFEPLDSRIVVTVFARKRTVVVGFRFV